MQALTKEIILPFLVRQPSQFMSSGFRGYSGLDHALATSVLFSSLFSLVAMKARQSVQFNPQNAIILSMYMTSSKLLFFFDLRVEIGFFAFGLLHKVFIS